jgi:SAM-dependent methyltransferase
VDNFGIDSSKYPMIGNPDWMYWGRCSVGTVGRAFTKEEYFKRYRSHNHKIVDSIVAYYNPQNVLSLGCGLGFDVERFVQLGIDVIGLEITQSGIDDSPVSEYIVNGSATDLSIFNDKEFDMVGALELMEHLPPELTEQTIREIRRVGRTFGVFTIGRGTQDPTHINLRPREEWMKLLSPVDTKFERFLRDDLKRKQLVDMVWDRVYIARLNDESSDNVCGNGDSFRS